MKERQRLAQEAHSHLPDPSTQSRGWYDLYLGTWALRAGQWSQAQLHLTLSQEKFQEERHKAALWSFNRQGQVALATGHFDEARQVAESTLRIAHQTEVMAMLVAVSAVPTNNEALKSKPKKKALTMILKPKQSNPLKKYFPTNF